MKNLKKLFRDIFLQGILNNKLHELDNYLIDKSLEDIKDNNLNVSKKEKEKVLKKLEKARLRKNKGKKDK